MRYVRVLVLVSAALLASTLSVSAASPSISLSVAKVRAGYGVTVHGTHFRRTAFVAIMFAYPKLGKHSYERFVGKARTNGSGSFTQQVQIPRIAQCGNAMLYGQVIGTVHFVGKRIILTGCKGVKRPPKPKH